MSDEAIPDDILSKAKDVFDEMDSPYNELSYLGDKDIEIIARAIQAERERCEKRMHQAWVDRDKITTSPISSGI